ncbi:hypothetical protein ASN18_1182 [Candidatus Magnetominusculus xianensis]|uniref:Uncharacterized protein n=1 Tax=Candidatus Magnetominusculus xianensis TaxID=1748249 RepID=A0ABR5SHV0_9BACT|nr:hypothetical protein ASN18_1182 [Candidatus Magnetominusculus xianensis]
MCDKNEQMEMDIEASQCVCNMEWRAIKREDESDDYRCVL